MRQKRAEKNIKYFKQGTQKKYIAINNKPLTCLSHVPVAPEVEAPLYRPGNAVSTTLSIP